MFASLVTGHWIPAHLVSPSASEVFVYVDASLAENRSVSLVRVTGGPTFLALSPTRSRELGLSDGELVDGEALAGRLAAAGLVLHDPDNLFYLTLQAQDALRAEVPAQQTRQLTGADSAAFTALAAEAPADELDEAYVELDHWLVYGTFLDDRLVSTASMYPWGGTRLADLGVITLPAFRGRGLARATVRAISAAALARGYEPQYRCQLDNLASVALARAAGFTRFGEWEVIDLEE